MKKLRLFPIMAVLAILTLSVVSCGTDDDEDYVSDSSSSLTINGKHIGKTMQAVCEEDHLNGEYWVSFGTDFYFMEDLVHYELSLPIRSASQLKPGDELIDFLVVEGFRVLLGEGNSDIGFGGGSSRYNDLEGSVKVKSISQSSVTLQFSSFSFTKSTGPDEKEYTFNGTVKYRIN